MKQKIIRVGNSAAVTIPKKFLDEAQLQIGSETDVVFDSETKELKIKAGFTADKELHELTQKIIAEYRPALEELAHK